MGLYRDYLRKWIMWRDRERGEKRATKISNCRDDVIKLISCAPNRQRETCDSAKHAHTQICLYLCLCVCLGSLCVYKHKCVHTHMCVLCNCKTTKGDIVQIRHVRVIVSNSSKNIHLHCSCEPQATGQQWQ